MLFYKTLPKLALKFPRKLTFILFLVLISFLSVHYFSKLKVSENVYIKIQTKKPSPTQFLQNVDGISFDCIS